MKAPEVKITELSVSITISEVPALNVPTRVKSVPEVPVKVPVESFAVKVPPVAILMVDAVTS